MTDFDAAEVARSVAELYEPLAEQSKRQILVEAATPILAHGNRELVSQALANLVDNALKHGVSAGQDSTITVSAGRENGWALLIVADHGPGIAAQDRDRAMERFVRLEASRSLPGSGLGLSLAAAVARLHGAELKLENNRPGLKATLAVPTRAEIAGA
jgi:signal transduction histidine kinase